MKPVIAYVNQFFGQIGGEDKADYAPELRTGAAGPAQALQAQLKDAEITHTIICGDNFMASHTEQALEQIAGFLKELDCALLAAGPAFNAGRYGFSCGEVCKLAWERFHIPALTSMNEGNPGVELYRKSAYILKGHDTAAGMRKDVAAMAALANKLLAGEPLLGADAEGYFGRGIRKEVILKDHRSAADRAVDMLLHKLRGEPFQTEFLVEQEDRVPPLPPVDPSKLRIAFVTTSGLVPAGNPDHLPSGGSTFWARYEIGNRETLEKGEFISVHGGYNTGYAAENPMVLLPLDALKQHVRDGHIGSLHPYYYVLTGNQTAKGDAVRMAREIVAKVREDAVQAIILGST